MKEKDRPSAPAHPAAHPARNMIAIGIAAAATVPGLTLELGGFHPAPTLRAILFGLAIVGAAPSMPGTIAIRPFRCASSMSSTVDAMTTTV